MKNNEISIHVDHVTRVEGHGNIVLNVKNGKIEQLQWQVVEAPRFSRRCCAGSTITTFDRSPVVFAEFAQSVIPSPP